MSHESEKTTSDRIRIELSQRHGTTLFTNPCGTGWLGKLIDKSRDGIVRILAARPVTFGLHSGSPDLVGWKAVRVLPSHVGKTFALFVGIEVKSDSGRLRPEQTKFLERLKKDGALSGVARSVDDAVKIVNQLEDSNVD